MAMNYDGQKTSIRNANFTESNLNTDFMIPYSRYQISKNCYAGSKYWDCTGLYEHKFVVESIESRGFSVTVEVKIKAFTVKTYSESLLRRKGFF